MRLRELITAIHARSRGTSGSLLMALAMGRWREARRICWLLGVSPAART